MAMANETERRINFLATALEQANETVRGKMDELSLVRRVGDAIIQDVVFICDRKWQIVDANPAAEALFGGDITGRLLTEFFGSPANASQFVQTVRVERVIQNFEAELLTDSNKRIVTLLSCVTDGDKYSGIIKDVTERTHLMAQVSRAQKMDSIGTLASGVAHDFNNILGIILPNAELIKMRTDEASPANHIADIIINATRRAAGLTKQPLSLSRKDPILLKTVCLNEAVRTTGKLLGETLDRKIRLEFDLTAEPTNIKADETQIEQVLLNLAINARDAMPEGGVLKFTTRTDGTNAIVKLVDTGSGIDPSILPNIFDPFFTTKDKSKGAGLGLSVAYGIVKQSGGSIDVKSEVGKGTEFIITLPLTNETRNAAPSQDVMPGRGHEKIMIVDDEPEMLNLLERLLGELGYTAVAARNGREGG
jgi:signal transduction histidine kinase